MYGVGCRSFPRFYMLFFAMTYDVFVATAGYSFKDLLGLCDNSPLAVLDILRKAPSFGRTLNLHYVLAWWPHCRPLIPFIFVSFRSGIVTVPHHSPNFNIHWIYESFLLTTLLALKFKRDVWCSYSFCHNAIERARIRNTNLFRTCKWLAIPSQKSRAVVRVSESRGSTQNTRISATQLYKQCIKRN